MKYKNNGQWVDLSIKALDSMEIGCIIQYMGNTIPNGWLECNGTSISQSAYPELYNLIGGTLPDFRGRVLVGQDTTDTDFDTLGDTGGEKKHKLTIDEMPSHRHKDAINVGGSQQLETVQYIGSQSGSQYYVETSAVGGDQAHNIVQPYAVVKHIIKAINTTPTMASIVDGYSTSTQDGYCCDYINEISKISTNETIIGYDDNNNPIYRKRFNGNIANNTVLVNDVAEYYGVKGYITIITGTGSSMPYYEYSTTGAYIGTVNFIPTSNALIFIAYNNGQGITANANFYVEYTKIVSQTRSISTEEDYKGEEENNENER